MKTLTNILLMIGIATEAYAQKTSLQHSMICEPNQRALHRTEIFASELPCNTDAYLRHEFGRSEFTKERLQALPLTYGPLSVGASLQHVDTKTEITELGASARLKGTIGDVKGKLDAQYYPSTKKIDSYGFLTTRDITLDNLASYNIEKKTAFTNPSIFYTWRNIVAGIEYKLSFASNKKTENYAALKLGIKI